MRPIWFEPPDNVLPSEEDLAVTHSAQELQDNEAVTYRVMSVVGDVSVAWHIWRGCVYRIFEALGCGEWPMTDTEELGPHNRGPCGPG